MATIVDCTGPNFRNILNPYTGEAMKIKMLVTPKGALYFAPDTYSTSQSFGSVAEARRQWSRVNGVYGCRESDDVARCAYTGEVLIPQEDGSYRGGFDPTLFHPLDEFLYFATMRDGVPTRDKPGEASHRVEKPAEHAPMSKSREPGYVEGALEVAGEVIKKSGVKFKKRSTVTAGIDLSSKKRKTQGRGKTK